MPSLLKWFHQPIQITQTVLELQALIRRMARENLTWGQKRIAPELLLKLGLQVSPRTVRKYMPRDCVGGPGQRCPSQRWSTCIRNHSKGLVVSGFTAEAARKAKAGFAHLRWLMQRRLARTPQRASSRDTLHGALVFVCLDDAYEIPSVELLNQADDMGHIERRPPARRPSRHPESLPAEQTHPAARAEVRSIVPVQDGQDLACPETTGIASAINRVIQSESWMRAA